MLHGFLADVLVVVHIAYASFIVIGLLLILVGIARRWHWIRNPWFRLAHLVAILIVAIEAVLNIACPLTVWEAQLRQAAGQEFSGESFIGRLIHSVLFVSLEPWMLNAAHVGCGMVVALTFVLAPPRNPFRKHA